MSMGCLYYVQGVDLTFEKGAASTARKDIKENGQFNGSHQSSFRVLVRLETSNNPVLGSG